MSLVNLSSVAALNPMNLEQLGNKSWALWIKWHLKNFPFLLNKAIHPFWWIINIIKYYVLMKINTIACEQPKRCVVIHRLLQMVYSMHCDLFVSISDLWWLWQAIDVLEENDLMMLSVRRSAGNWNWSLLFYLLSLSSTVFSVFPSLLRRLSFTLIDMFVYLKCGLGERFLDF